MTQDLLDEVEDGVAVLAMNRPDRLNAMSGPMMAAMLEALPRLAARRPLVAQHLRQRRNRANERR